MTTIFIDVLKQLIKEDISGAISEEYRKSRAIGHNHRLSLQQKDILNNLDTLIVLFESTGNDKTDVETIVKMLTQGRDDVQKVREEHHLPARGHTIECLNKLIFSTQNFFKKLEEFSKLVRTKVSFKVESPAVNVAHLTLLNKPYQRTPEHIIYYQACYYFGQEIFHPESTDLEVRSNKEQRLAHRLQSLSEVMKKGFNLDQQRLRALQTLKDLETDNAEVTKRMTNGPALPGLSFFGVQLTSASEWFSASHGRFGELFKVAVTKIMNLTPENSDCPITRQPKAASDELLEEEADAQELAL